MAGKVQGYVSTPDFQEDKLESLVDFQLNDNMEFWLVQLPDDQFPGLDGQKLTLDLDQDGELGSVTGPDAGKISRHVSLIHYPEPTQLDVTPKKWMPGSSRTPSRTTSHKSTLSETGGSSKSHKRGSSGLLRQSGDSGPGHSGISGLTNTTVSGSSEQSQHKKSKA